ncbi:MAG TPA: glycosyltransferase, partial [Pyrinomonadaceae bacterium]
MNSRSMSEAYEAFYYSHNCGRPYQRDEEWLRFFGSVAERIVRDIGPSSVLDAGCAMGFLVESLRARGVDAAGVDLSTYAVERAHPDVRPFCRVGSITDDLPQRYGLIVCIEVLEHLSPLEADQAIENFCRHTDDVLFSSTPFDFKEVTHLNVRPPDYWAQRFAQHGFFRDVDFDASFITPWSVRFRKTHEPAWRLVYGYERRLWQLEQEVQARRQLTVEQQGQLAELNRQVQELTEKAAEKEGAIQALSTEAAGHRETIESLTAALGREQERSRQLADESAGQLRDIAPLTAQLAAQYEQISSLIAPVISRQGSLEASLEQLQEGRRAVEGLLSQASENEKTIAALVAQMADKERAAESLRAELGLRLAELHDMHERARALESQVAEARAAVESQAMSTAENEQAVRTLSAALAARDEAIAAYKSWENGVELTIASLSRRRQEHEQSLDRLTALLAERDARLADVDSSMAWYLYNRLKNPYLHSIFRLYERVKKGYLLSAYKRLGLAASWTPAARLSLTGSVAPISPPAETLGRAFAQTEFPLAEVAPPPPLAPHAQSVDVIVCVHNAPEDVKRCLESVVSHTRMPYRLILVDDGSADETRAYLAAFAEAQGAVLLRNPEARGYTFAANQGLRRSEGDYVVLLNSDTVVTPLWLDRMIACGESDPQVGLVGPLSNGASWQSI